MSRVVTQNEGVTLGPPISAAASPPGRFRILPDPILPDRTGWRGRRCSPLFPLAACLLVGGAGSEGSCREHGSPLMAGTCRMTSRRPQYTN